MSHRIKAEECRDGRTFGQCAQQQGADVRKVGSFLEISTSKGTIHVADCNRAMPKQEQEWVYSLFCKIGLAAVVIGAVGLLVGAILVGVI